jgi:hypothetical protein
VIGIDPVVECLEAHIGFKQVRYAGHDHTSSMTFFPHTTRSFLLAPSAFLTGSLSQPSLPLVAGTCCCCCDMWVCPVMPRLDKAEGMPERARVK